MNYLAEPTVYERIDEYFSMIDKNDNPQVCFEKWVSILFQLLTKESGYFSRNLSLDISAFNASSFYSYIFVSGLLTAMPSSNQVSDLIFFKYLISGTVSSQQAIFM